MRRNGRRAMLAAAALAAAVAAAPGARAWHGSAVTGIEWSAEEVLGRVPPPEASVSLTLDGQGRAFGSSGCNRFTGPVEIGSGTMRFGLLAGTRRACPEPLMALEEQVLRALESTRLFTLDGSRSKMRLMDERGGTLMVLTR